MALERNPAPQSFGRAVSVPARNGFAMLAVPAMHEMAVKALPAGTIYEILISIPHPDNRFLMWQEIAFYSNEAMQTLPLESHTQPPFIGERGVYLVGRFKT